MQGDTLPIRSVAGGVARFLNWWREELWGLVPEYGRRLVADARPDVVLAEVESGYLALAQAATRSRASPSSSQVLPRAQAILQLAGIASKGLAASIGIRIPVSRCYVRRVEIPKAARAEAGKILDLDLERVTPFRLKDVYTSHLVEEEGAKGKLWVRQLVVKREAVDALIADVKAAGIDVGFVDCWDKDPASGLPVDFLEPGAATHGVFTLQRALAALVLALALAVVVLTVTRHEAAQAELEDKTAKMRERAALVRQILDRSDATIGDLARLQQMRLTRIVSLAILEEVSRLLPDSVWLSEFRLEGDVLDISGLAKSGAALPPLFAQSAIFTDAALTSPLTLDPREDRERFSLRVRVKSQAGSQKAFAKEPKG